MPTSKKIATLFLDRLNLGRKDDLYAMLMTGYDHIRDEINYFLDKLFPSHGTHLPYSEAKKAIQKSKLDPGPMKQLLFEHLINLLISQAP